MRLTASISCVPDRVCRQGQFLVHSHGGSTHRILAFGVCMHACFRLTCLHPLDPCTFVLLVAGLAGAWIGLTVQHCGETHGWMNSSPHCGQMQDWLAGLAVGIDAACDMPDTMPGVLVEAIVHVLRDGPLHSCQSHPRDQKVAGLLCAAHPLRQLQPACGAQRQLS